MATVTNVTLASKVPSSALFLCSNAAFLKQAFTEQKMKGRADAPWECLGRMSRMGKMMLINRRSKERKLQVTHSDSGVESTQL